MHNAWPILRLAWSAVMIVYCVLAIVADRRLRGVARKRSRNILIAIAVLVAIREAVKHFLGGWVYRFVVTIVGIAAGIAALIVATMVATQGPGGEAVAGDKEERVQSLKLS
jgi:hypothetical protein